MTLDQINLLKESYMKEATRPDGRKSTLGEYMRIRLDGDIDFVTSKDFVFFDEANELLHCICINDDARSQANFPVKIMSSEFGIVQQVETVMSTQNFKKFLNDGYISSLADGEKKEFLLKWIDGINNHALEPMDPDPAYDTNPTILPLPTLPKKREDLVTNPSAHVTHADGTKTIIASIEDAFKNAKDGDVVELSKDLIFIEPIELSNDVSFTIDLNGNDITSDDTMFKITAGKVDIINNGKEPSILTAGVDAISLNKNGETAPELNIKGNISITAQECCILTKGGSTVNIDGATLTSEGEYAAIQGNGNLENAGGSINLVNTHIESEDIGIYHPQDGILNIHNSYIEGTTAIYAKAGNINISGRETIIISSGIANEYQYNGNGANATGDAIVLDYCGYPGGKPSLTVKDFAEFMPVEGCRDIGIYDKNGDMDPDIAEETITLYGGLYSNEPNSKYCAEGYEVVEVRSDLWRVKPETNDAKVIFSDGSEMSYDTIDEAFYNITNTNGTTTATIKVMDNIRIVEPLILNSDDDITIDLNGKNIEFIGNKAMEAIEVNGGTLTINGTGTVRSNRICIKVDGDDAVLNIGSGVDIISKTSAAIFIVDGGTVNSSGNLTSKVNYGAIQGNGSEGRGNTTININGGTLTSEDIAIYHPQNGVLNINNATVYGTTGVYVKAGTVNIADSVIRGAGEYVPYSYNGNGPRNGRSTTT